MKNIKAEMKQEAMERMKLLALHENIIHEFEEETKLNQSGYMGIFHLLEDEKILEVIQKLEQKSNLLVYHVIYTPSGIGNCFHRKNCKTCHRSKRC